MLHCINSKFQNLARLLSVAGVDECSQNVHNSRHSDTVHTVRIAGLPLVVKQYTTVKDHGLLDR